MQQMVLLRFTAAMGWILRFVYLFILKLLFQEKKVWFYLKDVIARLCILDKRFKAAESIYLEHSQLDEAIEVPFSKEFADIFLVLTMEY
jgi:hypothetical protein